MAKSKELPLPDPASLANLRPPWVPGQSGNPGGRPKGRSLTTILREALEATEIDGVEIPGGGTVGDVLAGVLLRRALDGDTTLIKEVLDRVEGKVSARVELDVTTQKAYVTVGPDDL